MTAISDDGAKAIKSTVAVSSSGYFSAFSFEEYYEIDRSIAFVKQVSQHASASVLNVCLQLPNDLLSDGYPLVKALSRNWQALRAQSSCPLPSVEWFIMGDTSYGACCVDVVACRHGSAHCLIHYGLACFSNLSETLVPTLYIKGRQLLPGGVSPRTFIEQVFGAVETTLFPCESAAHDSGSGNGGSDGGWWSSSMWGSTTTTTTTTNTNIDAGDDQTDAEPTHHVALLVLAHEYEYLQDAIRQGLEGLELSDTARGSLRIAVAHTPGIGGAMSGVRRGNGVQKACCKGADANSCARTNDEGKCTNTSANGGCCGGSSCGGGGGGRGCAGSGSGGRGCGGGENDNSHVSHGDDGRFRWGAYSFDIPADSEPKSQDSVGPEQKTQDSGQDQGVRDEDSAEGKSSNDANAEPVDDTDVFGNNADGIVTPGDNKAGSEANDESTTLPFSTVVFVGPSDHPTLLSLALQCSELCDVYRVAFTSPQHASPSGEGPMFSLEPAQTVSRCLARRYYLVEKCKESSIIGLVCGSVANESTRAVLRACKRAIRDAGKKSYTIAVGKPNQSKLANFSECDLFVYLACPLTALAAIGEAGSDLPATRPGISQVSSCQGGGDSDNKNNNNNDSNSNDNNNNNDNNSNDNNNNSDNNSNDNNNNSDNNNNGNSNNSHSSGGVEGTGEAESDAVSSVSSISGSSTQNAGAQKDIRTTSDEKEPSSDSTDVRVASEFAFNTFSSSGRFTTLRTQAQSSTLQDIITPAELFMALSPAVFQWDGTYSVDQRELVKTCLPDSFMHALQLRQHLPAGGDSHKQSPSGAQGPSSTHDNDEEMRYSTISRRLVPVKPPSGSSLSGDTQLVSMGPGTVGVFASGGAVNAAEYFSKTRSFTGLGCDYQQQEGSGGEEEGRREAEGGVVVKEGLSGIAKNYQSEYNDLSSQSGQAVTPPAQDATQLE